MIIQWIIRKRWCRPLSFFHEPCLFQDVLQDISTGTTIKNKLLRLGIKYLFRDHYYDAQVAILLETSTKKGEGMSFYVIAADTIIFLETLLHLWKSIRWRLYFLYPWPCLLLFWWFLNTHIETYFSSLKANQEVNSMKKNSNCFTCASVYCASVVLITGHQIQNCLAAETVSLILLARSMTTV